MSYVDVVIPCYRYAHFLRESVKSVLADPAEDFRVLIIDDASPDNTAEVATGLAREDPRITFLRHSRNRGHIATYNEGIEWASGKYFLLLSADDYLLPGALRRAAEFMDAHPKVGFTFGKAIFSSQSGLKGPAQERPPRTRLLRGTDFIRLIERRGASNVVPTPTAVIRTELQKRVGGYRTELPHTGDLEMWMRLAAHGDVGFFESEQAVYRCHDANMHHDYCQFQRGLPELEQHKAAFECFFETCGDRIPGAEQLRRRMLRTLAKRSLDLANAAFSADEAEVCSQLSQFALKLEPGTKWSWPWGRLACKKAVGFRIWSALRPLTLRGLRGLQGLKALCAPRDTSFDC